MLGFLKLIYVQKRAEEVDRSNGELPPIIGDISCLSLISFLLIAH